VLALAFPLHPPGKPERSRVTELQTPVELGIPTLVVQGAADPFGSLREFPAAGGSLELVAVPGNHSPSRDQALVTRSVLDWLDRIG
jgi:predicted alpha/beta-hydrolase family hydrolase